MKCCKYISVKNVDPPISFSGHMWDSRDPARKGRRRRRRSRMMMMVQGKSVPRKIALLLRLHDERFIFHPSSSSHVRDSVSWKFAHWRSGMAANMINSCGLEWLVGVIFWKRFDPIEMIGVLCSPGIVSACVFFFQSGKCFSVLMRLYTLGKSLPRRRIRKTILHMLWKPFSSLNKKVLFIHLSSPGSNNHMKTSLDLVSPNDFMIAASQIYLHFWRKLSRKKLISRFKIDLIETHGR